MQERQTKAHGFRKQAEEARTTAARMSANDAKASFLRIAEDYDKLAEFCERDGTK